MNQMNNNDRIEKYFSNELSDAERSALEQQLEKDEDLKAAFERHQMAHRLLDISIAQNLKEQLVALEEENKVVSINRNKGRRFSMLQWAAAASVLLVIGFFAFFFQAGQSSPSQLASAYYERPELSMQRSAGAEQEDALARGIAALENEEYSRAVSVLDSIGSDQDYFLPAQYFLAHAHYLMGDFSEAEQGFERVSAGNDLRYREDAEWYGLLACLQQESPCDAKLDQIIQNNDHTYYEQATAIHDRIN